MTIGTGPILIVEDDADVCEALRDALEDAGYRVETATGVAQALEVLEVVGRPSIILLDLIMPGGGGAEVRRCLAEDARWCDVPVVLITADPNAAAMGEELRVAAVLRKPLRAGELFDVVARYAPSRR